VRSEIGIDVDAPPARVFELASHLERWPELLPHYRSVTVESHDGTRMRAKMVAVRRFGPLDVPVSWTAEQWSDPADATDLQLRFHHVRGATRDMHVTWHIRPRNGRADQARVTIEHVFSRPLPMVGPDAIPHAIDRLFVRPIAGRTLATFKSLAERPA
jgi:ribosome-associated toxin RatA of RatAB toxin-antitoxin module